MQRIKEIGGYMTADQLVLLSDACRSFWQWLCTLHDSRRRANLLRQAGRVARSAALARCGRPDGEKEACGNTVQYHRLLSRRRLRRKHDVSPYADALFRYLVRNKYNQNIGRKIKITFEGCAAKIIPLCESTTSASGPHKMPAGVVSVSSWEVDLVLRRRWPNFYKEFHLQKILNLAAAIVRLFCRYGERRRA